MNRPEAVALTALLVLLAWGLMYVGWRRRSSRQGDVAALHAVPPGLRESAMVNGTEGSYVSTTVATANLERITAQGLGAPSAARAEVFANQGILFARTGAPDVFIPGSAVLDVRLESVRLGKAVPHGLVAVEWTLGDRAVVTAFRTSSATERERLLTAGRGLVVDDGQGAA